VARSSNEATDHIRQPTFIAIEAGDHGCQHLLGIQLLDLERVAGTFGQQGEKGKLGTTISFAKGMDGI
jgi:hypothetical protein